MACGLVLFRLWDAGETTFIMRPPAAAGYAFHCKQEKVSMKQNVIALYVRLAAAILCCTIIAGCGTTKQYSQSKPMFDKMYSVGEFGAARDEHLKTAPKTEELMGKDDNAFFYGVDVGSASLAGGDYSNCIAFLDYADAALARDRTYGYSVKYYEPIMLNTYKALAYLGVGDIENARIEFNRGYERQASAIEENKKKIAKMQEKAENESRNNKVDVSQSISQSQAEIESKYPEFTNFKAYADYANPFATYLSGLFMVLVGTGSSDVENGLNYMKRVYNMVPENSFVGKDIEFAESVASGEQNEPVVWVFFENGCRQKSDKETFRIPFYLSSGVKVAKMSIPKLHPRTAASDYISVLADGQKIQTEILADMDRIVLGEFKERFPVEVTKSAVWMAINLVAQEVAQKNTEKIGGNKLLGGVVAIGIAEISNPVETRSWDSLPKNIQVARLPIPDDRVLRLEDAANRMIGGEIKLDPTVKYAFVYVRQSTPEGKASVSVLKVK